MSNWTYVPFCRERVFVYRLLMNGRCIYVGKTRQGMARVYQHQNDKEFDCVEIKVATEDEVDELEKIEIATHNPILNVARPIPRSRPFLAAQDEPSASPENALPHATVKPPSRVFLTVRQFAEQQPGFTEGSIRWDLYNRDLNGLAKFGAIIRRGRRILIDPERYLGWMDSKRVRG